MGRGEKMWRKGRGGVKKEDAGGGGGGGEERGTIRS